MPIIECPECGKPVQSPVEPSFEDVTTQDPESEDYEHLTCPENHDIWVLKPLTGPRDSVE